MFKNLKLSTKVTIAFICILLGMMTISISSYLGFNKIGSEIQEISEYQIPLSKKISQLEKDILQEEILTYELIIASKEDKNNEFDKLTRQIETLEKETDKKIKESEELIKEAKAHSHDQETKQKYDMFYKLCEQLEELQKNFKKDLKLFASDLKSGHLENIEHEKELLHKELVSMDGNVTKLKNVMDDLLATSTSQAQKDEKSALLVIEIISAVLIIFTIVIIFLITKTIRNKINNFQDGLLGFFKYLNRENTDVRPLDERLSDEFGEMSKVVNQNITITKKGIEEDRQVINDTIEVLSEFEQGDLCQRVKTPSNNPALQELTGLLNKMGGNIETNIDNVLNVLEEYSNSKYLNKVDTKGVKEHLLKLASGVNTLGDAITVMLIENKSNGLTLDRSSDILLENVETLSSSTNQAAASLEETAAALEQVTSNVTGNTQNIVKMASFANELSISSKEGEKLAEETTISMDQINEQVNAISEAISVIDQIAFQTNILSLNAAVEAATAGEAGKGFAVVAGEVRNLAARSAEAANEIKTLVENATTKANDGKNIADKMIDGYAGLNGNISKTLELIKDIEDASKEQLGGIEQINNAVTELDQQTQENANVASQTNEVAIQTDEIAKLVVSNVDEKEFIGKDSVEAKVLKKQNNNHTKTNTSKVKEQTTHDKNNDEWENF